MRMRKEEGPKQEAGDIQIALKSRRCVLGVLAGEEQSSAAECSWATLKEGRGGEGPTFTSRGSWPWIAGAGALHCAASTVPETLSLPRVERGRASTRYLFFLRVRLQPLTSRPLEL